MRFDSIKKIEKDFAVFTDKTALSEYIPDYIRKLFLEKPTKKIDEVRIKPFLYFIKLYICILTYNWEKVPNGSTEKLTHKQVDNHYTKIAYAYEKRHHKITNRRDMWWRRQIGFDAATSLKQVSMASHTPVLLDICTGIGLSLEEIFKVFKLEGIRVKAYGLDYNNEMLKIAKKRTLPRMKDAKLIANNEREIEFVRGNAEDLLNEKVIVDELFRFNFNSVDCITILCGIGCIDNQILSFEQQLKILRTGGVIIMFDMHRPIPDLCTPWPLFPCRLWSLLEEKSWEEVTVKLILRNLWAWADPTMSFYILPFVIYHDSQNDRYYGFETILRELNTEYWFFKLPAVSTAKIIVKKVEISAEEYAKRVLVLKSFVNELPEKIISSKDRICTYYEIT